MQLDKGQTLRRCKHSVSIFNLVLSKISVESIGESMWGRKQECSNIEGRKNNREELMKMYLEII